MPASRRPLRSRQGLVLALAALLALAGCSGRLPAAGAGGSALSSHAPPSRTAPTAGPHGTISWHDCGGGFQCGTLTVPLDWSKPHGRTISLAVLRKPATDPARRIGSVVLNPGGPGEAGTTFLRQFVGERIPADLNARLDLVSWDPRGTGHSDPIDCTTKAQFLEPDPDPVPDTPAETHALVRRLTHDMNACLRKEGDLLPYVGTTATVHDLDALRAALGDAKLAYVGFSYGTVIGTVYLQTFPKHVRAMVLDGVASTGADPVADTFRQARSFEKDLDAFLAHCKAQGAACGFGHGDPRGALVHLIDQLKAGKRLPADYASTDSQGHEHERRGTVGIGELYSALALPLYNRADWPVLAKALAAATDPTGPNPGYLLLSLRDQLAGRQLDGTWNNSQDAFEAISCADQRQRATNPLGDRALATAWAAKLPIFGAEFALGEPGCWKYPPARHPLSPPSAITGVPPVVLIGSTKDPATPYAQAVSLHRILAGSVLLTWEAADHTAYGRGSACLDDPVTAYLVTRKVPRDGLHCKPS